MILILHSILPALGIIVGVIMLITFEDSGDVPIGFLAVLMSSVLLTLNILAYLAV